MMRLFLLRVADSFIEEPNGLLVPVLGAVSLESRTSSIELGKDLEGSGGAGSGLHWLLFVAVSMI